MPIPLYEPDRNMPLLESWTKELATGVIFTRTMDAFARAAAGMNYNAIIFDRAANISSYEENRRNLGSIGAAFALLALKYEGYLDRLIFQEKPVMNENHVIIDDAFPSINEEITAMTVCFETVAGSPNCIVRIMPEFPGFFTELNERFPYPVLAAHWRIAGDGGYQDEKGQAILKEGDWGFFRSNTLVPFPQNKDNENVSLIVIVSPR